MVLLTACEYGLKDDSYGARAPGVDVLGLKNARHF